MDADTIVLKPFDPLRKYATVLGRENEFGIGIGIIISRRGAPFLMLLLDQYRSYRGQDENWAFRAVIVPHKLATLFPHMVHIEETSLLRPNYHEVSQINNGNYNWTNNYALHTYIRLWAKGRIPRDFKDVENLNTTFGEIARHVLK